MDKIKKILTINGKSQYDEDINEAFRPFACGPVTARIIMDQFPPDDCPYDINELFILLGTTKIGLFKSRFIRNMRKLLGSAWIVTECDINDVKKQILNGRPVAAKFDKWFNFRWRGGYEFDYHWVPVIGYEKKDGDIELIIHDNGARNRPSQVRQVSYKKNKAVLSFVMIEPK
ncbi:C39 family peptidase [Sporosarcina sp. FSL K6-2383]|uniref:C39 family peptidase n=1 Tax=Sporosarcina sp. FSL K6-2383 TaxID=2921556 RepID=UPI00315A678F